MKIVAEVAQAHDGSLGTALAYVKAIAAAGADAAKFQDHSADTCNQFRPGTEPMFVQDRTRAAYWARIGFFFHEWRMIRQACKEHGVEYIVSPFSMEAFEQQDELEPDRWKIASSKVNDYELIDACVKTGKPVIVSNGMGELELPEFMELVDHLPYEQCTMLQCTSLYPTPAEAVQIHAKDSYLCKGRGISDHSATIWPSICAAYAGLDMAEVHVVFSRECFGPDVTSSITTAELRQLVEGVRFVERMGTASKDSIAAELKEIREVFNVA